MKLTSGLNLKVGLIQRHSLILDSYYVRNSVSHDSETEAVGRHCLKISRDESKKWLISATSAAVTSWPLTSFHICYSAICLARHREKIRRLTLISCSRQSPLLALRRDINKQDCVSYRIPTLAPLIYARESFSSVKALGLSTMNMDWKTVFGQTSLVTYFLETCSIVADGDIVCWITYVRRQAQHLKCQLDNLTSTVDRALCVATCCLRYGRVCFLSMYKIMAQKFIISVYLKILFRKKLRADWS